MSPTIRHALIAIALVTSTACKDKPAGDGGAAAAREPSAQDGPPVAEPDPRDAQLRDWALRIGRQIADVAAHNPVDPSLHGPSPEVDLRRSLALTTDQLTSHLPEVFAVVINLYGRQLDRRAKTAIVVWSDERRAWAGADLHWAPLDVVREEPISDAPLDPDSLDATWPVLRAAWERVVEARARGLDLPAPSEPVALLLGPNDPRFRRSQMHLGDALAGASPWSLYRVDLDVLVGEPGPDLGYMRSRARWVSVMATTVDGVTFPANLSVRMVY